MEYGSRKFRLAECRPQVVHVSGVVVAARLDSMGEGTLQAIELEGGRTWAAEAVTAFAIAGDRVVAVPKADRRILRSYRLPRLEVAGEIALAAAIEAVATFGDLVAAALGDGTVALVAGDTVRSVEVAKAAVVAFSPDGRWLAVGTAAGRVAIVEVATGAVARTLVGGRTAVASLAWSPDGATIAAGCGKGVVLWPVAGGKAVSVYKATRWATVIGVTDRCVLAHGTQQAVVAIDWQTGTPVWELPQYGPAVLRGDRVLAARFGDVREIDAATGEVVRRIEAPTIHIGSLDLVGDTVVLGMSGGTRLVVGDLQTGAWQAAPDGHESGIESASFAGPRFATGENDGRAIVWERGRAEPVVAVRAPDGGSDLVGAVHLDGDILWAGIGDALHRFRIADGAHEASAELAADVRLIAPVGAVVLACAESSRTKYGELQVLDRMTLDSLHSERLDRTYTIATVDGNRVRLTGDRCWAIFDLDERRLVDKGQVTSSDYSRTALLSPDGDLLIELDTRPTAAGGFSTKLSARDLRREAFLFDEVVTDEVGGTADLAVGGDRFATPHSDGIRIWDARTAALLATLTTPEPIDHVRWFPDGRALLAWNTAGVLFELPVPPAS